MMFVDIARSRSGLSYFVISHYGMHECNCC